MINPDALDCGAPLSGDALDTITVLRCASSLVMAKTMHADGGVTPYSTAKTYDAEERPVASLSGLHALLRELSQDRRACVLRGALVDREKTKGIRRLLRGHIKTGDEPTLREVPRRWVAIDVDKLPRDPATPAADLTACAKPAIALLPSVFPLADCIVQATASHGRTDKSHLRLWFWLDRPLSGEQLKTWLKDVPGVDKALFSAAQITYTAAPVFEQGAVDPVPNRIAYVFGMMGEEDMVPVPKKLPSVERQDRTMRSIKNLTADAKDIAAAMALVPNDGPPDWEYFSRVGMAIWAATEGNEDGCERFRAWSERNPAHDDDAVDERWEHWRKSPPREIGAGSIFHWAREAQPDWRKPSEPLPSDGSEFSTHPEPLPPAPPNELSEDATARAFAAAHAEQFVFDHHENSWFRFTSGVGWELDSDGGISRAVRGYVRELAQAGKYPEKATWAAKKIAFSTAIERACQKDEHMAITRERWDADPFLLGVPGGHIDLQTGDVHPASPNRFVRRRTTVRPAPSGTPAPLWTRFLTQATGGDVDLQGWLQRFAGYTITADVREEIVAFFYGSGGNGKGVFVNVLSAIMGDLAYQAPAELFKADTRLHREYQLAKVDGKRLIIASETEAGAVMAEAFVKELSGNEGKINARHPYGRPFEFRSEAKLLIVGNHAPRLQGRSDAMERRLRVVPFNNRPAQKDDKLKEKLSAEYPAILRWILDGCLAWQVRGLGTCQAIAAASSAYFDAQDNFSQWIADRCEVGDKEKARKTALLEDFNAWLRARAEKPMDSRSFKEALERRPGCYGRHTRDGSTIFGLSLRPITLMGVEALMA